MRLVAFTFSGGGATAYRRLALALPPSIELVAIQPPGRENRLREPLARTSAALINDAMGAFDEIDRLPPKPLAFFGHSLGATIAFEVARARRAQGLGEPVHFFASARRAPHIVGGPPIDPAATTDAMLIDWVRGYGNVPEELLVHDDFLAMFLPFLRADFEVLVGYAYVPGQPLAAPLTALGGRDDRDVPKADMDGWAQHTTGGFASYGMEGGHFYFQGREAQLAALIERELEAVSP